MSEELMQLFAVTERDLPILDVLLGDEIIASFVPRGLWLMDAWGRIDVITKYATSAIFGMVEDQKEGHTFHWRLSELENRRQLKPLTKDALLTIILPQ